MTEEALFAEACQLTGSERVAFLDRACPDAVLRARVEALLAADAAASSPIEGTRTFGGPAATGSFRPTAPAENTEGTMIAGRYKLRQPIGEGGMGTVWMADQTEPVKRKVAVKLIKAGMDSKAVLARFEAERQALAMMDHPNIARVLDGGLHEGRPFFVMELVKGVPITQFCDERKLTPKERLELFVQACLAIQHAHQKGIIHRDIKPSNVLVALYDDKPVVKVIDFGVAKATGGALTEQTLDTGFGGIVGTPQYMSPEQATFNNLDIDTRSDVYTLGVLLYELLTGSPPFSGAELKKKGLLEILRVVREEEPPRPSTKLSTADALPSLSANRGTEPKKLTGLLRNELDWIVMKAIEKDRTQRYETANGFAADVQRYLAGEAVLAHPPSRGYRIKKFVRRNRGQVVATSLVVLALFGGVVGTSIGLYRANQARAAEAERADGERKAKQEALEAMALAEQSAEETLESYRASTDDAISQLIGSKPALGQQERTYLENTAKRWQAFANLRGDHERTRAIRGEGHYRVGVVWQKLGRKVEAKKEYEKAMAIYEELVAEFSITRSYREWLATCHHNLAILLSELGKGPEAEPHFRQSLALKEVLAIESSGTAIVRLNLGLGRQNLANLLSELGKWTEAEEQYREAMAIVGKLADEFPKDPTYRMEMARFGLNFGNLLKNLGRRPEAEKRYRDTLAIQEKLAAEFPEEHEYRRVVAQTRNNLGVLLAQLGKSTEAEEQYRQTLPIQKKLVADFPTLPEYRLELSRTHFNLGNLLPAMKKPEEAEEQLRLAMAILEKLVAEFSTVPVYRQILAEGYGSLGEHFRVFGKWPQAEEQHRLSLAINDKLAAEFPAVPEYREQLAASHNDLGIILDAQGKRAEAESHYRKAMTIDEKLISDYPGVPRYKIVTGGGYCNFGNMLQGSSRLNECLEWYDKAIRTLTPLSEQDRTARWYLRNSHWSRARAHDSLRKYAEAVNDWARAVELSPPEEQPDFRARRAMSQLRAGRITESVAAVAELMAPGAKKWAVNQWYDFACIYAVASVKVADKKAEYADRAMELLSKAVKVGFKDAAHLKKDTDLDPLRDREDFKNLLAELETQFPPREKK